MAPYLVRLPREIKKALHEVAKSYGMTAPKLVQAVMNLARNIKAQPQKGIVHRIGHYGDSDGVFLEQTSDGVFLVLRSSAVDTRITEIQREDHFLR